MEKAVVKDIGVCFILSYQESLSLLIWEILDFPESLFGRLLFILVSQNWVNWPLLAAKRDWSVPAFLVSEVEASHGEGIGNAQRTANLQCLLEVLLPEERL